MSIAKVLPPMKRLLALDAGQRRVKLLALQSEFGRWRLLRQEMIDLQADGLVSTDEAKAQLQSFLIELGHPPIALVLPQHLSISQVIDLPVSPEDEVERLVAEEAVKLGGVADSRIVYDFVRARSAHPERQQFWVTLCQESEIRQRISTLGIEREDICEVTTTANALVAAFNQARPQAREAILVHSGAQSTVLVRVQEGRAVYASSFQMGGDFLTRSLARVTHDSEEAAETLKRTTDLLHGQTTLTTFVNIVDGWLAELKRQLNECLHQSPGAQLDFGSVDFYVSGGTFRQPGLLEYLSESARFTLQPWPSSPEPPGFAPEPGFEVAFGTALQALGKSPQPVSLLPDDYRRGWRKRLVRRRIELASLALAAACGLLLAIGTWQKMGVINSKDALLKKITAAQESLDANTALSAELLLEFESMRPLVARQQNTIDVLATFSLLQNSRSNQAFWYVLMADQRSYFSFPPTGISTNRVARTNLIGPVLAPFIGPIEPNPVSLTNQPTARPGIIAEICVPGDGEKARKVLGDLVSTLKQEPRFAKADSLSEDLRRNLADPKVVIPDRHFALALDFAESDFDQPVMNRRILALGTGQGSRPSNPRDRTSVNGSSNGSRKP